MGPGERLLPEQIRRWRTLISSERMLDREFATRFLAFYLNGPEGYKPDLDTFLTSAMAQINTKSDEEINTIRDAFDQSMKLAEKIFGRWAFRKVFSIKERRKPINKALFEVWSVELAKLSAKQKELVIENRTKVFNDFVRLMNDDDTFVQSITSATGDRTRVNYRYAQIRNLLNNITSV